MRSRSVRHSRTAVPLTASRPVETVCLELTDHTAVQHSAIVFFHLKEKGLRDPQAQAARLSEQFIKQNQAFFSLLDVHIEHVYDGDDVRLVIHSASAIGAIPLISPATARPDLGLVIQPRFPWAGIGPMLANMGWRITPTPLKLPLLHRSERRIPVWVLCLMIFTRLKALLTSLDRKFEFTTELLRAPRGSVHWPQYAIRNLPKADFLSVPCSFPDLREDRLLKGAVRYVLERQLRALETQKEHGAFVHKLIEFGQQLLRSVQTVPSYIPTTKNILSWYRRPLRAEAFFEGLQAIEWAVDERGLAGMSDLEGIPWTMSMDKFFEAWVESVFQSVARQTGGHIKVGRRQETTHPIQWDTPYLGSQRSLVPDIWIEWDSITLIVDAKYKRHWEELQLRSWRETEAEFREQHRNDLLQILAYANLARTSRVIVCLAYPCSPASWESLRGRGRLIHRADLTSGSRSVHLWLTAVPMSAMADQVAVPFTENIRQLLVEGSRERQ